MSETLPSANDNEDEVQEFSSHRENDNVHENATGNPHDGGNNIKEQDDGSSITNTVPSNGNTRCVSAVHMENEAGTDLNVKTASHIQVISTDRKEHAQKESQVGTENKGIPPKHLRESMSDMGDSSIIRGKANSPISQCTDVTRDESLNGSRELAFKRAMSLMSARCQSQQSGLDVRAQTPLIKVQNPPLGQPFLQLFYVNQRKPLPMPPMKAWRGYHGNVYFEPIQISTVSAQTPRPEERIHSSTLSCAGQRSIGSSRRSVVSHTHGLQANSVLSGYAPTYPSASKQLHMRAKESVGSLRISSGAPRTRAGSMRWERSKVRKGSVVREVAMQGLKLPPINHAVFRGFPVRKHQPAPDSRQVMYTTARQQTEITSRPTR